MKKELLHDFTTGNVTGILIRFAFPMFISNVLQLVYRTVDTIVVGQKIGSIGVSATSVGGDLTSLLTMLVSGFTSAASIIISQHIGAGKKDRIGPIIGTLAWVLAIASVVFTAFGLILRVQLLQWMNTPQEAFDEALAYSTITIIGLIFVYGYNGISSVLRGLGDSKHPLMFIIISSLCNVVLDLIFVFALNMGSFGAGLATTLSQGVSFVCSAVFLAIKRDSLGFEIHKQDWKIRREYLSSLTVLGLPMAAKMAAIHISKIFTNSFINSYGLEVCAVTSVGTRICAVAAVVGDSLSGSGGTVVGQNIGAQKYDRVLKVMGSIMAMCVGAAVVFTIILLVAPGAIFGIFTADLNMVIVMEYVPIIILMFFANATRSAANAFINGSGNHKINWIVAILDAFVLRVGLGLLLGLAFGMQYKGFWLGSALSSFAPLIIGGIYMLGGNWKTRKYIIKDN